MRLRIALLVLTLAIAPGAVPALADDLTGATKLLCASVQATACTPEEDCAIGPPWVWDIPDFIEIDLDAKSLSTTKTSAKFRTTPIKHLERAEGLIILQGVEAGRAFSFVITEATGFASVAVARDGRTVGLFGTCTPINK